MSPQEVDKLLLQTLQDRRLSGGERDALRQVFSDQDVDEQTRAFCRHRAFELARAELADLETSKVVDWLEAVVKALQPQTQPDREELEACEACFSPGHDCPRRIAELFARARRSVDVCVFTITDDRIAAAIFDAHHRGVALRIVSDNDKALDLGSDIERFAQAGIAVRLDRSEFHMHHKFAIFDGRLLVNGSYNWTRGAAEQNHENLVLSSNRRLVAAFAGLFEKLWEQFA